MTSWVVSNSGILLSTVLPEGDITIKSHAIWSIWTETNARIAAPFLFQYELVASIRKHVNRGTINKEEGERAIENLLAKSETMELFITTGLLKRAYQLATEFQRPTAYDSQYIALAEQLGCEFWTADQKLHNIFSPKLSWVKWVGDFKSPSAST